MQKNKVIFYLPLFIITLQGCFYSSIRASKQEIALEALKVLGDGATCFSLANNVYELGKGVNTLVNPNQERQNHAQTIQEQLKVIELRKNFMTCLVENRTSTKKDHLEYHRNVNTQAFYSEVQEL